MQKIITAIDFAPVLDCSEQEILFPKNLFKVI